MPNKNSMTALWERWYLRGYGIKGENGNIVSNLVNSHKPFISDLGSCRKLLGKLEQSWQAGVLVLNLSNGRRPPKRLEIESPFLAMKGRKNWPRGRTGDLPQADRPEPRRGCRRIFSRLEVVARSLSPMGQRRVGIGNSGSSNIEMAFCEDGFLAKRGRREGGRSAP